MKVPFSFEKKQEKKYPEKNVYKIKGNARKE